MGGKAEPGFNKVFNCHDMAEWQHSRVKVYIDGQLEAESPTLQSQGLEWVFNVSLPPSAQVLRLVAMPAQAASAARPGRAIERRPLWPGAVHGARWGRAVGPPVFAKKNPPKKS